MNKIPIGLLAIIAQAAWLVALMIVFMEPGNDRLNGLLVLGFPVSIVAGAVYYIEGRVNP